MSDYCDIKDSTLVKHLHVEVFSCAVNIDPVEEAKLRRKLDWRLLPILTLIYLFAFIDRSNVGNARVLGMEKDLKLDGHKFNIGLSAFFVTYILLEVPANIACKKLGPRIWIPFLAVSFGITTAAMSTIQNYHGFVAARTILGVFEAGIMPGITFTLSCFYRRHELVSRVGLYASVASLSGAFGGLLASGLSQIPPWASIHTWRNIFFFEGLTSVLLGIVAFIILPASLSSASFLTEEEKRLAVARIEMETKSSSTNVVSKTDAKRALLNLTTVLFSIASFCTLTTMNSMALFVPSILRAMGFSGLKSQLMSVPPYAWAATVCVTVTLASDRTRRRGLWILTVMPFTVAGFAVLVHGAGVAVRYLALFLCLTGAFTASPMFVAWAVDNSAGPSVRAIVAGTVVGFGNIGGLVATWTYTLDDAPNYRKGHSINLGLACLSIVFVSILMWHLHRANVRRSQGKEDYRLEGKTAEEIRNLGHDHPEFKFTV